ncbi:hypothetical protein COB57_02455 [Candidatus Peregrinibacteria bacterium]|nr:MAG: hypothetical protein COB57_02455 [Candidatus Peregrinibacteria bacterium]
MIKNIIFDWSGTLLNNFDQLYEVSMSVFKTLGKEKLSKEKYKTEHVAPYMNFWNKYIPNITREEQNTLFKDALSQSETPALFPGVEAILEELQENNIKLFLLSSQPKDSLIKQTQELEIAHYFHNIIGDADNKKISMKKILKKFSLNPKETVSIGDTIAEVNAGKSLKLMNIAVTSGFHSLTQLQSVQPHLILENLNELTKIIKKY